MESLSIDVDLMADPGVKNAWDKYQTFNAEITAAEKRINEINGRIGEFGKGNQHSPTERAAQALVAGSPIKDIAQNLETLRRDLSTGYDRLRVLKRAAELQRKKLGEEETRASRAICESLEPAYREIIARLAKTMIALGHAKMADIAFFDKLSAGGIPNPILRRMNIRAMGDPYDRNGAFAQWFMEAIAFGLIDEAAVPAIWRERWNR